MKLLQSFLDKSRQLVLKNFWNNLMYYSPFFCTNLLMIACKQHHSCFTTYYILCINGINSVTFTVTSKYRPIKKFKIKKLLLTSCQYNSYWKSCHLTEPGNWIAEHLSPICYWQDWQKDPQGSHHHCHCNNQNLNLRPHHRSPHHLHPTLWIPWL